MFPVPYNLLLRGGQSNPTLHYDMLQPAGSSINSIVRRGPVPTFTRASTAWSFNASGNLVSVGSNVPRFDHDPITLARNGFLIEQARTNFALWSSDMTNAAWAKTTMTAAKNATGLDGVANSASTLTATAANATATQALTKASATNTYSVWVKRKTGSGTVEIANDAAGTNWTALSGLSSLWFTRYTLTTAAVTNPIFGIRIVTSGDEVEVDGNQLETGAYATSPIPTTSASVTRAKDITSITGTNFSSFHNQAEGTWLGEFMVPTIDTAAIRIVLESGPYGEHTRLAANVTGSTSMRFQVVDNSVTQADLVFPTFTINTVHKLACAYALNNFAGSLDSSAVLTDTAGTVGSPTELGLGARDGATGNNQLDGWLRAVKYWKVRKSNSFLISATAA